MDLVLLGQIQDGEMEKKGEGDKIQQSLLEKLVERGPFKKKKKKEGA